MFDRAKLDSWNAAAMAPELTDQERMIRDQFVREYLIDYDPFQAALRVGYVKEFAAEYAAKFMSESYVAKQIKESELSGGMLPDEAQAKSLIKALLFREASSRGTGTSQAARVAALSKLMSLYAMDAPTKVQSTVEVSGGVSFYIPHNGRDPLPEEPPVQ